MASLSGPSTALLVEASPEAGTPESMSDEEEAVEMVGKDDDEGYPPGENSYDPQRGEKMSLVGEREEGGKPGDFQAQEIGQKDV